MRSRDTLLTKKYMMAVQLIAYIDIKKIKQLKILTMTNLQSNLT